MSALLTTAAFCSGSTPQAIADELGDAGSGALKATTAEAVNEFLSEHRSRRRQLEADKTYVDGILAEGNDRANAIADSTLAEVRAAMGMDY